MNLAPIRHSSSDYFSLWIAFSTGSNSWRKEAFHGATTSENKTFRNWQFWWCTRIAWSSFVLQSLRLFLIWKFYLWKLWSLPGHEYDHCSQHSCPLLLDTYLLELSSGFDALGLTESQVWILMNSWASRILATGLCLQHLEAAHYDQKAYMTSEYGYLQVL